MAVPYTFGAATASIPLSQLDSNFATTITLGNVAVQLGNTVTSLTGVTNVASATSLTLGSNGNTTAVTIDASQNVGINGAPNTWSLGKAIEFGTAGAALWWATSTNVVLTSNIYYNGANKYAATAPASFYQQYNGVHAWYNAPSGTAGTTATMTQAMTLDASGNLRLGTTNSIVASSERLTVSISGPTNAGVFANGGGATDATVYIVNQSTSGNNLFTSFATEAGAGTVRGSITYNRAGGLTVYNTTSDYRSKTVNGPVQNALSKLAALKPCTGRMNGAETDIDFFVAHELQEVVPSAVTGVKDAIREEQYEVTPAVTDETGKVITEAVMGTRTVPDYQMVDKSALIPLLTAALQEQQALITSLTERIIALEAK